MIEQFIHSANATQRAVAVINGDPELRRIAYDTARALKLRREAEAVAAAEREGDRPERLQAFWQETIGFEPEVRGQRSEVRPSNMEPAAAFIAEHPAEISQATCPTLEAMQRLVQSERRRLKSVRRILRELGIK
jgi:hypothetical protein